VRIYSCMASKFPKLRTCEESAAKYAKYANGRPN
jgi:hypothetical protein